MAATASSSRRSKSIGVSTLFNQSPPQPPSSPDPDPTIHPADPRRCAAFPSFSRKRESIGVSATPGIPAQAAIR
jgi:hypothetical protein